MKCLFSHILRFFCQAGSILLLSKTEYDGPRTSFCLYWNAYGGIKALCSSLYFRVAIIFGILISVVNRFAECPWDWQDTVIATLPSILGFSLGGYAILVGFGDATFRSILCKKMEGENESLYMRVNASLLHFILVQSLALLYAVLTKALHLCDVFLFSFVGTTFYIYALEVIISTCFAVLNLANWLDKLIQKMDENKQK